MTGSRSPARHPARTRARAPVCEGALALWGIALALGPAAAGAERRCVVGAAGLTAEGGAPSAEAIAAVLREKGCEARTRAIAPGSWDDLPPGAKASEAAAFVTAGFGEQAGAYAFEFAGPGGAVSAAAFVPYRKTWRNWAMTWVVPDRAIAFGLLEALAGEGTGEGGRVALALRVTPLEARASRGGALDLDDLALDETDAAGAVATDDTLDELSAADVGKVLPAFRAMALWGAWDAGYRPGPGAADARAELAVRTLAKAATLRLRVSGAGGTREVLKERVREDDYQAAISRMFRQVALGGALRDFGRAAPSAAALLGVSAARVLVSDGTTLRGVDPATGRQVYPPPEDARPEAARPWTGGFARRRSADGTWTVLRHLPKVARVNPVDGSAAELAPAGVERAWQFDVTGEGGIACALGWDVALFKGKARHWSRRAGAPVTCGPLVVDDLVIAGTEAGDVLALAAANGDERWRARLPGRAYGRPAPSGRDVLVFCAGDESLCMLGLADGRTRWRRPVGDALVTAPEPCAGGVLVASKANRLMLLDPAAGSVRRELAWPAWIVDVARAGEGPGAKTGGILVVTDRTGAVAFVDPRTLGVARRVDLGRRPVPGIVFAEDAPARWAAASGAARALGGAPETAPAVAVCDAEGFVYLLAPPRGGE